VNYFKTSFLLLSLLLTGCSSSALFVVNNLARFGDYTVEQNIHYGAHHKQTLDVYQPSDLVPGNSQNIPVVIFFYGGCWGACSDLAKEDYRFVAQAFTANNFIAVVVDYRQFPNVQFPAIMTDATAAVEWVSDNIASYGGSSNNIFFTVRQNHEAADKRR